VNGRFNGKECDRPKIVADDQSWDDQTCAKSSRAALVPTQAHAATDPINACTRALIDRGNRAHLKSSIGFFWAIQRAAPRLRERRLQRPDAVSCQANCPA